jgi:hypothetical protein
MRVRKLGRWIGRFLTVAAFAAGAVLGVSSLATAGEDPVEPPGGGEWEDVRPASAEWG